MTEQIATQGGVGVDFSSPLFQLSPSTIAINQPNTQLEGAIRGKLRITDTGQQFEEMVVTLLKMPTKQRAYYTGQAGQLNRTPDNLECFSRDSKRPDVTARVPQSVTCDNCQHGDLGWNKWRQTKLKEDIPQCDAFYHALFIDTVFKMPLQMFVRSKSKGPFEDGMKLLARTLYMLEQSTGTKPNIYDISFKISTKKIMTGALPSYVLQLSDFKGITEEERAVFGKVYLDYAAYANSGSYQPQIAESAEVDVIAQSINKAVESGAKIENIRV